MPVPERSSVDRWTIIRRRDWPQDHGSLLRPGSPMPAPDPKLVLIEVVPLAEVERLREALVTAYDAMVHRPVDGELFRLAIREVQTALRIDPDAS